MDDFEEFFLATRHGVFRTMVAATGGVTSAEDAVAEAYARAFALWPTLRGHPNTTAWVLRTALNVHRSVWRRVRREVLVDVTPDRRVDGHLDGVDERVRAAVRALPRRQREVVALRLLADLDAEQTAEALGMAPATVHVHLHRALATLRRVLDDEPPQDGAGPDRTSAEPLDVVDFSTDQVVRHAF